MRESFVQQAIEDLTFSRVELGFRRVFYPLGFPLELQTNSWEVIEAASENWGLFSQRFDTAPMRFALGVKEIEGAELRSQKSSFFARDHLMTILIDADNFVVSDYQQFYSYGWITRALASDSGVLRYRVLTPAAMMMAECLALAPLHGALVARNDCGVVLCGDSFAGKSTLAYACAKAGWTYVSDDGTFLLRNRLDRYAVGDPHFFRLREDARELFPELAEHMPIVRPNGKIGIEVPTRELAITTAPGATVEHVVFINRQQCGSARLRCCPKDRIENWSEQYVTFGPQQVRADMIRCHQRLLTIPAWELSYSNFEHAVQCLDQLVESGG
jgi:hypothetical protein